MFRASFFIATLLFFVATRHALPIYPPPRRTQAQRRRPFPRPSMKSLNHFSRKRVTRSKRTILSAEDSGEDYYPTTMKNFVPGESVRIATDGEDDDDDDEGDEEDEEEEDEEEEKQKVKKVDVAKTVRASVKKKGKSNDSGDSKFKGIDKGMIEGTNVTHLSYMVFKLIKSYDVKSVVDMPCRNTHEWFPQLLPRLDFEVPGFRYYCVDSEQHSQDDIRGAFSDAGSPQFLHIRPEEASNLPNADLVFSWDGPQQWGVKRTWAFFTAMREVRPKYIMITNNPGVLNTNDERGLLNLRKQPFHVSSVHLLQKA